MKQFLDGKDEKITEKLQIKKSSSEEVVSLDASTEQPAKITEDGGLDASK